MGERLEAPIVFGEFGLDVSSPGAVEGAAQIRDETDVMAADRAYGSNDLDRWALGRR